MNFTKELAPGARINTLTLVLVSILLGLTLILKEPSVPNVPVIVVLKDAFSLELWGVTWLILALAVSVAFFSNRSHFFSAVLGVATMYYFFWAALAIQSSRSLGIAGVMLAVLFLGMGLSQFATLQSVVSAAINRKQKMHGSDEVAP